MTDDGTHRLSALPFAAPDDLDIEFWDGCRRRELLVQQCQRCRRTYWPATSCAEHGGADMRWVPSTGRGTLHTFAVYRHAFSPAWATALPYIIAVVELDAGPFVHTSLIDCDPDDCAIGMAVHVEFRDHPDGYTLPVFAPIR